MSLGKVFLKVMQLRDEINIFDILVKRNILIKIFAQFLYNIMNEISN